MAILAGGSATWLQRLYLRVFIHLDFHLGKTKSPWVLGAARFWRELDMTAKCLFPNTQMGNEHLAQSISGVFEISLQFKVCYGTTGRNQSTISGVKAWNAMPHGGSFTGVFEEKPRQRRLGPFC